MHWILDNSILLMILVLVIALLYSYIFKKEKTDNKKGNKVFSRKGRLVIYLTVLIILYIYNNKDEWVDNYWETKRMEYKIEMKQQYKLLQDNSTKIGKWRAIEGSEYIGFYGATYVSIYKKDDLYSMVLYSKESEIMEIHQSKNNDSDIISFPPLIFSQESQELVRFLGTLRDTCERIN